MLWLILTCPSLKCVFADKSRNINDILAPKFSAHPSEPLKVTCPNTTVTFHASHLPYLKAFYPQVLFIPHARKEKPRNSLFSTCLNIMYSQWVNRNLLIAIWKSTLLLSALENMGSLHVKLKPWCQMSIVIDSKLWGTNTLKLTNKGISF